MPSMSTPSLVALFAGTVILVLLAFEVGLRFGRWRSQHPDPEPQLPVRTLVASILSLLAFILGFTFGLASTHFDSRNQSVFEEAIAIQTAYHRADFLSEPERTDVQRLLREYVDLRLEADRPGKVEVLSRVRKLQNEIWTQALAAGKKQGEYASAAPLISALIDVIDVHGERVLVGFRSRIPLRVWSILYGIMVLSVASAGYLAGLAGARHSIASLAYALIFAAVIVMIALGDVPTPLQIKHNNQALVDLRLRIEEP